MPKAVERFLLKNIIMRNKSKGFTLIELLVVIAIIGILSSVVLASLNSARQKSRDAKRVADMKQLQLALELYYDANSSTYPTEATVGGAAILETGPMGLLTPASIAVLPSDPSSNTYKYYSAAGATYCIGVDLEGASTALASSNAGCETTLGLSATQGYAIAP